MLCFNVYQAAQNCLAARDSLGSVASLFAKVTRLQQKNLSLQVDLETEKKAKLDAEDKLSAEVHLIEKERLDKDQKVATAEKEVKAAKEEIERLKEEQAAAQNTIKDANERVMDV